MTIFWHKFDFRIEFNKYNNKTALNWTNNNNKTTLNSIMNAGEFIDEVVEIFDGPHADGFAGLLKQIEEMVERDEDACDDHKQRKQQVAELTAEKANLQIKMAQLQYMLKVLEDGAEEDERENAELRDRVTCLESDSHNEVSQAEFDDMVEDLTNK